MEAVLLQLLNYECFILGWFALCMVALMPGPSNLCEVRGVSSYKFVYVYEKVLGSGLNI